MKNGVVLCIKCHNAFHRTYGYDAVENPNLILDYIKNEKVVRVIGPGELITQGWIDEVDGVVDITLEVLASLEGVPSVGDTFLTSGDQYSIPPGSFIFKNL